MMIQVNGKPTEFTEGCTVRVLLAARGLEGKPCAVEVNKALVPKREHGSRELREGDAVEIVTLVGGG